MIVADHEQHAALFRCAGGMAVTDCIARPIHARPFAVPQAEHAIDCTRRIAADPLCTGYRGSGKILVHRREKPDVMLRQRRLGAPYFGVDARERGAAVATDESGRADAVAAVGEPLHHQHAHQSLGARCEHAAVGLGDGVVEAIVEIDDGLAGCSESHDSYSSCGTRKPHP